MLELRRITDHKRFIPQIDGLRFVAISSVVFVHIYDSLHRGAIPPPFSMDGDIAKRGVELFFVISGFILGVPFASRYLLKTPKVNLKQYYLRRLTRLEPPYFISLLVCALAQYITAHRSFNDMAPHLAASFLYLHNLIFGAFVGAVNPVAWSLEIEIQFYLLVPVLALLFSIADTRLRRALLLLGMFSAGILTRPLYRDLHLRASILYYIAFFLAGFLLCDLYLTRKEWTRSYVWDAMALPAWPLVWYLGRNSGHLVLPFVIVLLYLAAFRGKLCSAIFSNRVITNVGGMCYSIYLFHALVVYAVKHQTWQLHIGQNFWVYLALQTVLITAWVLLFCGSFFLLIERPCMDRDWPKKFWRAVQAQVANEESRISEEVPTGLEISEISKSPKAS